MQLWGQTQAIFEAFDLIVKLLFGKVIAVYISTLFPNEEKVKPICMNGANQLNWHRRICSWNSDLTVWNHDIVNSHYPVKFLLLMMEQQSFPLSIP